MYSCKMVASSGSSNQMTLATETQPSPTSYVPSIDFGPSGSSMQRASRVKNIDEIIEKSKSHWSQLVDLNSDNEVAEVSNMEFFKTLQEHPTWGSFFKTFGKGEGSCGELVVGEKFAKGGQVEIYEVQLEWDAPKRRELYLKRSTEYVLKVFKKGLFLCHLQAQWPQGMLQHHADKMNLQKLGLSPGVRLHCGVICGTLLEDGRFAFLMVKEKEDLRNVLNHRMLTRPNNEGPFSNKKALKAMYEVAFGMNQMHNCGIVHRDIKASNVLISRESVCLLADFECSVGVVGTGFFRAREILEACKLRNVSTKAELFTKVVDIYSYGMTCFEILIGKLPFEGHPWKDYDLVLKGQRPKMPNYVDGWIQQLLNRCWKSNPIDCPTSQEILKILLANSTIYRNLDSEIQAIEAIYGVMIVLNYKTSKTVEMWRSLQLTFRLPKLKMLNSCRK